MNLILDFGNTITKVAVFSRQEIVFFEKTRNVDISYISALFLNYPEIKACIISSVADHSRELMDYLKNKIDYCIELDSNTPIPVKNKYKTPQSLGYDRIAGIVGANTIYPDENILVIDAGSAITFDFLNNKNEFLGGNISPGANMRAKALNKFTSRLPLINPETDFELLGDTTETAINSGIMNGILFEIEAYINQLKNIYPGLKVFLTGGDNNLFDKKLKNYIFVDSNLNLKGLNRILDYNASS